MNRDDELLASIVEGELTEDSPQARELFVRRPELRERAVELVAVRRELDRGGELERAVIADSRAETSEADRARVARALTARVASRRAPRWARIAVIAAGVVIMGVAGRYVVRRAEPPAQVNVLNGAVDGTVELLSSASTLAAGQALEWNARPLAPSERFKLQFRAFEAGGEPGKLLREIRCASATWTPTVADLAAWPEQVSLTVLRVEADNADRELARSPRFSLRVSR